MGTPHPRRGFVPIGEGTEHRWSGPSRTTRLGERTGTRERWNNRRGTEEGRAYEGGGGHRRGTKGRKDWGLRTAGRKKDEEEGRKEAGATAQEERRTKDHRWTEAAAPTRPQPARPPPHPTPPPPPPSTPAGNGGAGRTEGRKERGGRDGGGTATRRKGQWTKEKGRGRKEEEKDEGRVRMGQGGGGGTGTKDEGCGDDGPGGGMKRRRTVDRGRRRGQCDDGRRRQAGRRRMQGEAAEAERHRPGAARPARQTKGREAPTCTKEGPGSRHFHRGGPDPDPGRDEPRATHDPGLPHRHQGPERPGEEK
ncbi:unnamed protein product [Lota lota]